MAHDPARTRPGDGAEDGPRLQPAPGRRRDQHGRHAHPPGRAGAQGPRRLHDQRQHRRLRPRRPPVRRLRRRVQPAVRHRRPSRRRRHVKERVQQFLAAKKPGQPDTDEVLKIKGLIRATEARAAALACGIPPEQLEFMDLRFYRTGTIAKDPLHPEDIDDIVDAARAAAAGPDLRRRRAVRPARHAPDVRRGDLRGGPPGAGEGAGLRGLAVPRRVGGVGAARDRDGRAAQPGRAGAEEAGDLPAPVAEGPGDVPRRHATAASSGSGPRTATAPRQRPTTRWACRSSTPWRRSCGGRMSDPEARDRTALGFRSIVQESGIAEVATGSSESLTEGFRSKRWSQGRPNRQERTTLPLAWVLLTSL